MTGVGLRFAIPHDLAHFAIDTALHLDRGFWGSVAAGAVLGSMEHRSGRRKPHTTERSEHVLKENRAHITEAECLVSILNDAMEKGQSPLSSELRARLREFQWSVPGRQPRQFTEAEIMAACEAWDEIAGALGTAPGRWENRVDLAARTAP